MSNSHGGSSRSGFHETAWKSAHRTCSTSFFSSARITRSGTGPPSAARQLSDRIPSWPRTPSTNKPSRGRGASSVGASTSSTANWGDVQPKAADENAFLASHSWSDYAEWHLGLTDGAPEEAKARYGFVYGDFRRLHRTGLIACHYRAAEWRHKEIELAAHELLQLLDRSTA